MDALGVGNIGAVGGFMTGNLISDQGITPTWATGNTSGMGGYTGTQPTSPSMSGGIGQPSDLSYGAGLLSGVANVISSLAGRGTYSGGSLVTNTSYPVQPSYYTANGSNAANATPLPWNPFSASTPAQIGSLHFTSGTVLLIIGILVLVMISK